MIGNDQFPTFRARHAQMFPVLSEAEIARLRRYGSTRRFAQGERLFTTGKPGLGMLVVLEGAIDVSRRDGHGRDIPLVEHGRGSFAAEVGQLQGKPAFVDGTARGDVEVLLIPASGIRAVLVGEAELGEKIMRALILRRVGLIEAGAGGPVLIGEPDSPGVVRLRNFLTRNGHPHLVFDPSVEEDARILVARENTKPEDLPLVVCPDGTLLRNPTEAQLARCIGMVASDEGQAVYDVVVAGAGPAGLATAVYAASEGLSVVVVDARAFGGQAGASMRIENYLGFPTGISGQALAGRAFTQAQKFGAQMRIPMEIETLECESAAAAAPLRVRFGGGGAVRGRTVVIATGARYRRPAIPSLEAFEGNGVSYWASPIEAKLCVGQEIALVGGGNSAGQAAVYLAGFAAKVWMLVRGPGLADSMSKYLIDRIEGMPNIVLTTRTEIVALDGARESGLAAVRWRHRDSGREETRALRHVFLFVGADPATEWLRGCGVQLDANGFVRTGGACDRKGASLGTSIPGVFAVGDVRSGSVKRVGAAIGEGAAVVAQIHAFLASEANAAEAIRA